MARQQFHNLTDAEREHYNLPPAGFQGNEFTAVIEAPTMIALDKKLDAFKRFAAKEGYEHVEVISKVPDPDGGYKAIMTAHNFNPIAWASEQLHRAKLGATEGWKKGKVKAEMKHQISSLGELEATKEREIALQRARIARIRAAAPERITTEEMVGVEQERRLRERRLAQLKAPDESTLVRPRRSLEQEIFMVDL